jgi:hypothetical protein
MGHIVLLGDSIFDNARYVPDRPPVIEQLRQVLPPGWDATLLAVDGHVTDDVANQLRRLPPDATHLVVSAGGNDALGESLVLNEPTSTVEEALELFYAVCNRFRNSYRAMLQASSRLHGLRRDPGPSAGRAGRPGRIQRGHSARGVCGWTSSN